MIIVCGGIKGGSGKTTLATNLTVLRSKDEKKVLLIDADEQKSSWDWVEHREALQVPTKWTSVSLSGKSIHSQILKLKDDYDDVIIDVGGRDTTSQRSSLIVADRFIIPFKPRSFDVWTLSAVRQMIVEIKTVNPSLQAIACINQADIRGQDNKGTLEILQECEEFFCFESVICQRKSYSNAVADGLGVTELKNPDPKAIEEIQKLYKFIFY